MAISGDRLPFERGVLYRDWVMLDESLEPVESACSSGGSLNSTQELHGACGSVGADPLSAKDFDDEVKGIRLFELSNGTVEAVHDLGLGDQPDDAVPDDAVPAAFDMYGSGDLNLSAPVTREYGRGGQALETTVEDGPGVLRLEGVEWAPRDDACCGASNSWPAGRSETGNGSSSIPERASVDHSAVRTPEPGSR